MKGLMRIAGPIFPKKIWSSVKQWIYSRTPIENRMGEEYWKLKDFLDGAQWWDQERILAWQINKMKEIVKHAYENTSGYNNLYREAGIKPDDINSVADVRFLPFTTKELIRDNLNEFTARNIPSRRRYYVTTGGSTGIPLGFYRTDINKWMEKAFMHIGWEWLGWKLGNISATLRGSFIGSENRFWEYNPTNNELLLSSYYLSDRTYIRYISKIIEFQPVNLRAYPSTATILADLVIKNKNIGDLNFELILLGSESIFDWQKKRIRKAFPNSRVFAWYGHSEQTILAPWCEKSETYHVWPYYGLSEILDSNDLPVNIGCVGEIIGTSFWNQGTPFIRYRTGDLAEYKGYSCSCCSRNFELLEDIVGRTHHTLISESGRTLPLVTSWYVDIFSNVQQFQFYQDTPGKVVLKIVKKESYHYKDTIEIYNEVIRKLDEGFELNIVFVDEIPKTRRGKFHYLDQKLNVHGREN
jgi:phenylacetate-CoA ligase